jgi:hypothetical protein
MQSLIVTLVILNSFSFLLIGGVIAFIISKFYPAPPRLHPEMYDQQGNIRPDILYAVTFDNNYDNEDEDSDYQET